MIDDSFYCLTGSSDVYVYWYRYGSCCGFRTGVRGSDILFLPPRPVADGVLRHRATRYAVCPGYTCMDTPAVYDLDSEIFSVDFW